MENICQILNSLFQETKSDDIIDSWLSNDLMIQKSDSLLDIDLFSQQIAHFDAARTLDQARIMGKVVKDKLFQEDKSIYSLRFSSEPSVFNALLHYSNSRLAMKNNKPICQYNQLLSWHEVTRDLGEDLFVTSYLASIDSVSGVSRKSFDWEMCLEHNSSELNEIFSHELMDIHAHLKGSSYNFELNWLFLMNHVCGQETNFKKFDKNSLSPSPAYVYRRLTRSLYVKIIIAAAIRQFLFLESNNYYDTSIFDIENLNDKVLKSLLSDYDLSCLNEEEGLLKGREKLADIALKNKNVKRSAELCFLAGLMKCTSLLEAGEYLEHLQSKLNLLRYSRGRRFYFRDETIEIPDYALVGKEKSVRAILCGERKLMYQSFKHIYNNEWNHNKYSTLFYIYLLIKEEFRKEMVQINQTVGFANFSLFENRKTDFIPENSVWDRLLPQLAVGNFLRRSDNASRYMEVRITPKMESVKDIAALKKLDRDILDLGLDNPHTVIAECRSNTDIENAKNKQHDIDEDYLSKYHYVFHFIKTSDDDLSSDLLSVLPRHAKLRLKIELQAKAIFHFRNSGSKQVRRLVGIDAANSEILCRPEVFATAFRFLNAHKITTRETECPKDLGLTYHVGEDFYDIADGLRAVDEVLEFLQFRNGSRLGHALVLGTDVYTYYKSRNYRINITKQVLLDNVAWLYIRGEHLGASVQILSYLREIFCHYYEEIYGKIHDLKGISIWDYFQSWLLRGDNPSCYIVTERGNTGEIYYEIADDYCETFDPWRKASINCLPEVIEARKNQKAVKLLYHYHYSESVKKIGSKGEILRISPSYRKEFIKLIETVQAALLNRIESYHIAIECNPSSNYKIGEMRRYDEHPITKFYNKGLNTPYKDHHICVSINTDDAGVFSTTLEREYSLIALALEKVEDEHFSNSPRDIKDWLNNIRKMSREQVFFKNRNADIDEEE